MKIGLIRRGHSGTGGAEAYLLRFAAEIVRHGHEPFLVTTSHWPVERWPYKGVLRLRSRTPAEFASEAIKVDVGCDVVLSLERTPGCDVYRAGDGVHAAWLDRRSRLEPWWRRATRWINPKHGEVLELERKVFDPANTRIVIANSQMVKKDILDHFAFPEDRIHVIYNGIVPIAEKADRTAARQLFGISREKFVVLFVGSGWQRKGLATAVKAVESIDDALLVVAGRGQPERYPSSRVKFLGAVSNLAPVFAAADVFVLPTHYDPFSNACLEALAAGLPVMTTTANGFSEILTPGTHGEIFEPGDADALAAALAKWRKDDRAAAARGACRSLAAKFPITKNVEETLALLEKSATAV